MEGVLQHPLPLPIVAINATRPNRKKPGPEAPETGEVLPVSPPVSAQCECEESAPLGSAAVRSGVLVG